MCCFDKCIKDNYGGIVDQLIDYTPLSFLSLPNVTQELYNNTVQFFAKETLTHDYPSKASLTEGDIIKKMNVSDITNKSASKLSGLTKVLGLMAKTLSCVGAAAGGVVAGAISNCSYQCM